MEELTQAALAKSSNENLAWRKSLPKNWLNFMGTTLPPQTTPQLLANPDHMSSQQDDRVAFLKKIKENCVTLTENIDKVLDNTSDLMARTSLHERLPIAVLKDEKSKVMSLELDSQVRLVRPGIARMLIENGKAVVYHLMANSKEMHGNPLQPLEFEIEDAGAIGILLASYPTWVKVEDLPVENNLSTVKMEIC